MFDYIFCPYLGRTNNDATKIKSMSLNLFSFETKMLVQYAEFCRRAALFLGFSVTGSVPLPTKYQRWSILKSPHVHKTSWTQFERRTHQRLIQIYNAHPNLIPIYIWYIQQHVPSELWLKMTTFKYESSQSL